MPALPDNLEKMKIVRGYEVGPNDVFCGHRMNWSGGNKRLGKLVHKNMERYNFAQLDEKSRIAHELLNRITQSGGKFLKEENKKIVTLTPKEATTKIMQKFRDTKKAKRQQIHGKKLYDPMAKDPEARKKDSKKRPIGPPPLANGAGFQPPMKKAAVGPTALAKNIHTTASTMSSVEKTFTSKVKRLLPLANRKANSKSPQDPDDTEGPSFGEVARASVEDHSDTEDETETNEEDPHSQFDDADDQDHATSQFEDADSEDESDQAARMKNRREVLPTFARAELKKQENGNLKNNKMFGNNKAMATPPYTSSNDPNITAAKAAKIGQSNPMMAYLTMPGAKNPMKAFLTMPDNGPNWDPNAHKTDNMPNNNMPNKTNNMPNNMTNNVPNNMANNMPNMANNMPIMPNNTPSMPNNNMPNMPNNNMPNNNMPNMPNNMPNMPNNMPNVMMSSMIMPNPNLLNQPNQMLPVMLQQQQMMINRQQMALQESQKKIQLLEHVLALRDKEIVTWHRSMRDLTEAGSTKDQEIQQLKETLLFVTNNKKDEENGDADPNDLDQRKLVLLQKQVIRLTKTSAAKDQELLRLQRLLNEANFRGTQESPVDVDDQNNVKDQAAVALIKKKAEIAVMMMMKKKIEEERQAILAEAVAEATDKKQEVKNDFTPRVEKKEVKDDFTPRVEKEVEIPTDKPASSSAGAEAVKDPTTHEIKEEIVSSKDQNVPMVEKEKQQVVNDGESDKDAQNAEGNENNAPKVGEGDEYADAEEDEVLYI